MPAALAKTIREILVDAEHKHNFVASESAPAQPPATTERRLVPAALQFRGRAPAPDMIAQLLTAARAEPARRDLR